MTLLKLNQEFFSKLGAHNQMKIETWICQKKKQNNKNKKTSREKANETEFYYIRQNLLKASSTRIENSVI